MTALFWSVSYQWNRPGPPGLLNCLFYRTVTVQQLVWSPVNFKHIAFYHASGTQTDYTISYPESGSKAFFFTQKWQQCSNALWQMYYIGHLFLVISQVTLEKVLGITAAGNRALACDPHSGLVAYPAGWVTQEKLHSTNCCYARKSQAHIFKNGCHSLINFQE